MGAFVCISSNSVVKQMRIFNAPSLSFKYSKVAIFEFYVSHIPSVASKLGFILYGCFQSGELSLLSNYILQSMGFAKGRGGWCKRREEGGRDHAFSYKSLSVAHLCANMNHLKTPVSAARHKNSQAHKIHTWKTNEASSSLRGWWELGSWVN